MAYPTIPLAALSAILGAGVTLAWYYKLPDTERDHYDRKASDMARKLFGRALNALNPREAQTVVDTIRPRSER